MSQMCILIGQMDILLESSLNCVVKSASSCKSLLREQLVKQGSFSASSTIRPLYHMEPAGHPRVRQATQHRVSQIIVIKKNIYKNSYVM